jgi:hypothetical protein
MVEARAAARGSAACRGADAPCRPRLRDEVSPLARSIRPSWPDLDAPSQTALRVKIVSRSGARAEKRPQRYLRDMVKRWPTQRIALLCGAPLGFFSGLLLADPDDSSIYNVVGECIGAVVVGVLLVGVVCAGRNWIRGAK